MDKYAIDVNGKGWESNCPDWDGVFFGDALKMPGALGMSASGYSMICEGEANAEAIIDWLNKNGDWVREDGEEERPVYGMRPAEAEDIGADAK